MSSLFAKRQGLAVAAVLLVIAIGALCGGRAYAQEVTPTTEIGVVTEPSDELLASLAECKEVAALAPAEAIPPPEGATGFVIDSAASEARYEAQEELARIGANTAVGRTNAFIGQLFVDETGMPVACSRFDVDMRTLVSDESRRDNFLRGNTLESDQFPVATFVVRGIEGLDAAPEQGKEVTFYLIGDLTLHGITQLAVWEATATFEDGKITGTAATEFDMPDYDIDPPIVGSVISIEDTIRLIVDITAIEQKS